MAKSKTIVRPAYRKKPAEDLPIPPGKGEVKLERKKAELVKAKENYYRLCREFIELWTETRRAQRQA
jgi:hypothetical protein